MSAAVDLRPAPEAPSSAAEAARAVEAGPRVTASVVLFRDDPSEVERLVRTLLASRSIARVYLIDNSPSPFDGRDVADPRVELIRPESNLGFGKGHNLALAACVRRSRYHLIANVDTEFEPSAIDAIAAFLDARPEVGAATPRIVNFDRSPQTLPRLLPSPLDLLGRRFFPRARWTAHRMRRYEMSWLDARRESDVAFVSGSFMFLRCETLRQVGLFDERFFLYAEDLDLSRRIAAASKTVLCPDVEVAHRWRRSSHKTLRGTMRAVSATVAYFNKWGWFADPEREAINARILASAGGPPPA